jgi:hypothetical protein
MRAISRRIALASGRGFPAVLTISDVLLPEIISRLKQPSLKKRHAESFEGIAAAEEHIDSFGIATVASNGNNYVRCGVKRHIRNCASLPDAWEHTEPDKQSIEEAGNLGRRLVNGGR